MTTLQPPFTFPYLHALYFLNQSINRISSQAHWSLVTTHVCSAPTKSTCYWTLRKHGTKTTQWISHDCRWEGWWVRWLMGWCVGGCFGWWVDGSLLFSLVFTSLHITDLYIATSQSISLSHIQTYLLNPHPLISPIALFPFPLLHPPPHTHIFSMIDCGWYIFVFGSIYWFSYPISVVKIHGGQHLLLSIVLWTQVNILTFVSCSCDDK